MFDRKVSSERNCSKLQEGFSRRTFIRRGGCALAGAMLASQGDMRILFSNYLVGGLTALALAFLFWPVASMLLKKMRGGGKPAPA